MRHRCVIDASLALAWIHPQQASERTDAILLKLKEGATLVVPALLFLEVANALLILERRRKLRSEERHEAIASLRALNFAVDFEGAALAFGRISELAEKHHLSVYDATYLELALREHLPLGTVDERLQEAA